EGTDHAGALHRLEDHLGLLVLPERADEIGARQRLAERAERIAGGEIEHCGALADPSVEIDAELLDDLSLDLRDRHLEHHLVTTMPFTPLPPPPKKPPPPTTCFATS